MRVLDVFNAATRRYMQFIAWNRPPELLDLQFWDFVPHQSSTLITGLILATFEHEVLRIEMNITMEDLCSLNNTRVLPMYTLIDSRIREALRVIEDYVEDPFDKWVREVRKDAPVGD
jgi:hypothetical protein